MTNALPPDVSAAYREKLVPGYETDLSAVGIHRVVDAELDDPRPWHEVHGLSEDEATALVEEHG